MKHEQNNKYPLFFRLRRYGVVLGIVLLTCYLCYFTIFGQRGWLNAQRVAVNIEQTEESLARLQSKRETLEHNVVHLRPSSLDLDLLEEETRKSLGYVAEDEIVVRDGQ